jgi:hypothetical protein
MSCYDVCIRIPASGWRCVALQCNQLYAAGRPAAAQYSAAQPVLRQLQVPRGAASDGSCSRTTHDALCQLFLAMHAAYVLLSCDRCQGFIHPSAKAHADVACHCNVLHMPAGTGASCWKLLLQLDLRSHHAVSKGCAGAAGRSAGSAGPVR